MSTFKIPEPHPNLSRNGFDLSSRRLFTNSVGQLLPVGVWEVNPSEHFRFSVQDLIRTQPLNTAAFARCKEYYHFFFVPYSALWMYSDAFFTGVTNPDSSARRASSGETNYNWVPSNCPHFNLDDLLAIFYSHHGKVDALGYNTAHGAYKLLNMLGYGICSDGTSFDLQGTDEAFSKRSNADNKTAIHRSSDIRYYQTLSTGASMSLFRILAYQRIYNDFYRNQKWEKPDVESFNVDWISSDNQTNVDAEDVTKMFTIRYRQWNKDLITSCIPTPNYNEGIFELPNFVGSGSFDFRRNSEGIPTISHEHGIDTFSPNDIRALFALDKMLEVTRRAHGLDYQSQISAHFGFNVPESRKNMARFIGGFDNTISIGEVIATANGQVGNESSVVGQVTGKGIGSLNSHPIDFDVKEHGIIMCIHSIVPQPDYNSFFVDSFNTKLTREDYYQPEFQDLGYVPIKASDLVLSSHTTVSDAQGANNVVLGYTPRYSEYKSARDVVFGSFMSNQSLSAWCTPRWDFLNFKKVNNVVGFVLSASNFMIDPAIMDNVFSLNYNGKENTSQFLINSYFDVKAVRPMSVTGLSSL